MKNKMIGLGYSPSTDILRLINACVEFLTHIKTSENFVVLGSSDLAYELDQWAKRNSLTNYLGHFEQVEPFNEPRGSFNRMWSQIHFYKQQKIDYFFMCCTTEQAAEQVTKMTRTLQLKFNFKGSIVLPFQPKTIWENEQTGSHHPILIHSVSRSGTMRFWPVFRALLIYQNRGPRFSREPYTNHSFMSKRRKTEVTQAVTQNALKDPVERIRHSVIDPEFKMLSSQEIKDFHLQAIQDLDFYQFQLMHMHVFAPIDDFLHLPEIQWVALLRDPRDVIVSFYFAVVQLAYELDHQYTGLPFPSMYQEALLLSLIEKGWQSISFSKILNFPNIKALANHYLNCMNQHKVKTIQFEDIHQNPEFAYTHLLNQLHLTNDPFHPIQAKHIKRAIHLGTFEYQTQGQRKRGQLNALHTTASSHRKGIIGDWKNHFTEKIKEKVKELIGLDLIELGYEADLNW